MAVCSTSASIATTTATAALSHVVKLGTSSCARSGVSQGFFIRKSLLSNSNSAKLRLACPTSSSRITAWFNLRTDAETAGIYASQSRDEYDSDDVAHYFNYMGMLAAEGSYDKMEALLNQGIHAVDILLLLAASEGDRPKIEELMRAGALYNVCDTEGRTALDRACDDEIRELILSYSKQGQ